MIVITGATGTVGRPLIDLLADEGVGVRAITRTPHAAGLPASVRVAEGDPSKPETIAPAVAGATALFLHPRAVGDAAGDLVALAGELGVRRVVTLAAANVDDDLADQPSRYRGDRNKEAEDATANSGLEGTSLRPSSFTTNTLHAWADQIRVGDLVRYVYATFQEPPSHRHRRRHRQATALRGDPSAGGRTRHAPARQLAPTAWRTNRASGAGFAYPAPTPPISCCTCSSSPRPSGTPSPSHIDRIRM
jgi:uncharacterized protein YbjT (DUF2867 family)